MGNPELVTAVATVAIAAVTATAGGVSCYLIWRGIREMGRSSNQRAETAAKHGKQTFAVTRRSWTMVVANTPLSWKRPPPAQAGPNGNSASLTRPTACRGRGRVGR